MVESQAQAGLLRELIHPRPTFGGHVNWIGQTQHHEDAHHTGATSPSNGNGKNSDYTRDNGNACDGASEA